MHVTSSCLFLLSLPHLRPARCRLDFFRSLLILFMTASVICLAGFISIGSSSDSSVDEACEMIEDICVSRVEAYYFSLFPLSL